MGKKTPKAGYDVGYGKPPKHTQFKPGESGNPSGKKKENLKLKEMFLDEAQSLIKIKENGTEIVVSKIEMLLKALFAEGAKGDLGAIRIALDLHERAESLLDQPLWGFSWDEEAAKLAERMEELSKKILDENEQKESPAPRSSRRRRPRNWRGCRTDRPSSR